MTPQKIHIEMLPNGRIPIKAHATDAAYDCFARKVEDFGHTVVCHLGFKLEVPEGWFADLRPRSGIYKAGLSLSNSAGIVDSGYRGEVRAMFYRVRQMPFTYESGDRVCQMMLRRLDPVSLIQVPQVSIDTPRGEGGFGSTGR